MNPCLLTCKASTLPSELKENSTRQSGRGCLMSCAPSTYYCLLLLFTMLYTTINAIIWLVGCFTVIGVKIQIQLRIMSNLLFCSFSLKNQMRIISRALANGIMLRNSCQIFLEAGFDPTEEFPAVGFIYLKKELKLVFCLGPSTLREFLNQSHPSLRCIVGHSRSSTHCRPAW